MPLIVTPRQLAQRGEFYHQLGQLVAAGIGLVDALEMQARKPPNNSFREPLRQLVQHLKQGRTFSDALMSLGHWAPEFDIALIQAGEKSGRLDAVFKLLGSNYSERAHLLRQMISDLLYPVFVFHFAAVLFPFIDFFRDGRLGMFILKTLGVLVPIYVLIYFMIYAAQGRRGLAWRTFYEKVLRPVPVLGAARQYLALARLSAALEALLNAGVNVIQSWDLAAAACGSPAIQEAVSDWRPRVEAGLTPAEAVSAAPVFPEMFANLYHSGEVSGQLDESLSRLHAYYLDEGRRKLRSFSRWVPQIVYLGVAGIIAYRIIHFYMDYFDQVQKAGGF